MATQGRFLRSMEGRRNRILRDLIYDILSDSERIEEKKERWAKGGEKGKRDRKTTGEVKEEREENGQKGKSVEGETKRKNR